MATINNCSIFTVFPLGVTCSVTGTTSPITSDGAVEITITGGTEPYYIQWLDSNNQPLGISSTFRNNLDVGDYKSIVTDVYGDFSATTICSVTPDDIFVEEFTNCYDLTVMYVSGNTPSSLFTLNKIYTLVGYSGCWEKTNRFLNTSALPYVYTTRLSGPYNYCSDCLPAGLLPTTPTPTQSVSAGISSSPTPTPTPSISAGISSSPTPTPTQTKTPTQTPTKTPTQTPTPSITPSAPSYTLTLNTITSLTNCARGTITIKKNGTTVATYSKLIGTSPVVPSVGSINYLHTDIITIITSATYIAGSGCFAISDSTTDCTLSVLGSVSSITADSITPGPITDTYTLTVPGNYTVTGSFIAS